MSTHRAIACPKCGTGYKVRADAKGKMQCKQCGALFSVGGSKAGARGAAARDTADQRLAKRLMIIAGVVVVFLFLIIGIAGNTDSGTARPDDGPEPIYRSEKEQRDIDADRARQIEIRREKIGIAKGFGQSFLEAIAAKDEEGARELFIFDTYFERRNTRARRESEKNDYATAGPDRRAELEQNQIDALLNPEHGIYIKKELMPRLMTAEKTVLTNVDVDSTLWQLDYQCPDEDGSPLFKLSVSMGVRPGLNPDTEWGLISNLGVVGMSIQWLQAQGGDGPKVQRGLIDVGSAAERRSRRARTRTPSGNGGPPEADPVTQSPIEGTGETQTTNIRRFMGTLTSGGGAEVSRARENLASMGRIAIPFLLNELVGRNHRDGDKDIASSWLVIQTLREITGENFGYAPGQANRAGFGVANATPEERETAVRRWFGWWKRNARTWTGKKELPPDEDIGG